MLQTRVLAAAIGGVMLLGSVVAVGRGLVGEMIPETIDVRGKIEVVVRVEGSPQADINLHVPPVVLQVPRIRATADVSVRCESNGEAC